MAPAPVRLQIICKSHQYVWYHAFGITWHRVPNSSSIKDTELRMKEQKTGGDRATVLRYVVTSSDNLEIGKMPCVSTVTRFRKKREAHTTARAIRRLGRFLDRLEGLESIPWSKSRLSGGVQHRPWSTKMLCLVIRKEMESCAFT